MPDYEKFALEAAAKLIDKPPAENDPRFQGIASARGYDQEVARLKRVHYSHDAMIDAILANPTVKQAELAKMFGHGENWISRIMGSDAFQAALAKRRADINDPFIVASVEERLRGLAIQSLDILADKLEKGRNVDVALKSADIALKAMGFGARLPGNGNAQQNNFVVVMPQKIDNPEEWAKSAKGKTIEAQ